MRTFLPLPSLPILHRRYSYDQANGGLLYASSFMGKQAGSSAGRIKNGRAFVDIGRHQYAVARLVWLICKGELPEALIDHIDGDPLNNHIENLRIATDSENAINRSKAKNNTSGFKGVAWNKQQRKWQASLGRKGGYLGLFETAEAAHAAYMAAAQRQFGDFARAA